MRLRNSVSFASGTFMWKGRIASGDEDPADMIILLDGTAVWT
jgi:hypothetical protein